MIQISSWCDLFRQALFCISDDSLHHHDLQSCGAAPLALLGRITCSLIASHLDFADSANLASLARSLVDLCEHTFLTYPYKDVPSSWRQLYTDASLARACCLLRDIDATSAEGTSVAMNSLCRELIRTLDMAIIVSGAPGEGRRAVIDRILGAAQDALGRSTTGRTLTTMSSSISSHAPLPNIMHPVERLSVAPDLISFSARINSPKRKPALLPSSTTSHWPALSSRPWSDLDYLLSVASDRLVPIEIGSQYTSDGWTQQIMRFGDFIEHHVLHMHEGEPIAYLAQHDLLAQIPILARDMAVPDYCFLGSCIVTTNVWFGPAGTISPLHKDPGENLFVQVVGRKYFRLYAPQECVYPFEGILSNTSQVDVERPDLAKFPGFAEAEYVECVVGPGEMLYIPVGVYSLIGKGFRPCGYINAWWRGWVGRMVAFCESTGCVIQC